MKLIFPFYLSLYVLSIFILGYSFLCLSGVYKSIEQTRATRNIFKIISCSYIYGSGFCAFLFFYFGLCGIKSSASWILLAFLISLVCFLVSKSKLEYTQRNILYLTRLSNLTSPVCVVAIFAIGLGMILIVCNLLFMPLWDVDSFALWGLKSRAIFYTTLDKDAYFHRVSYGFSHLEYPLLVPLLNAGVYICAGQPNQMIGKILYIPLILSFGIIVFSYTAEKVGDLRGIGLTALYISLPSFVQWSSAGTAEIYIVVFYFTALYFSVLFLCSGENSYLLPAVFANIFLVFTKNEGLPIAFFNLLFLMINSLILRNSQKVAYKILTLTLMGIVFLIPWFVWSHDIPRIHENYPARLKYLFDPVHIARLADVSKEFFRAMIDIYRWGFFWFLFFFSLLIAGKNRVGGLVIPIFLANAVLYVLIFLISPWDLKYLSVSALERLLLHLSAPAYFMVVLLFQKLLKNTAKTY